MLSLKSTFDNYADSELPDATDDQLAVVKQAFYAGALVLLVQVEDPGKSIASQRRKLRSVAQEIRDFQRDMILRKIKL